MFRERLNAVLLLLFLFTLGLRWAISPDASRPNYVFLADMTLSIPYDSFSENENFSNGMTLQEPPAGTISRDELPLHYQATPEDALRAGEELISPFDLNDPKVLKRGATLFSNFCMPCHGPEGKGDGPITKRGYPPPASLLTGKSLTVKDGTLFHILTYGQVNMPSYATQLSREDRWKVIAHVRSLHRKASKTSAKKDEPASKGDSTP